MFHNAKFHHVVSMEYMRVGIMEIPGDGNNIQNLAVLRECLDFFS